MEPPVPATPNPWTRAPSLYLHVLLVLMAAHYFGRVPHAGAVAVFDAIAGSILLFLDFCLCLISLPAMVSAALASTALRILLWLSTLVGGGVGLAGGGFALLFGLAGFPNGRRFALIGEILAFIPAILTLAGAFAAYAVVAFYLAWLLLRASNDELRNHAFFRGLVDGSTPVVPEAEPSPRKPVRPRREPMYAPYPISALPMPLPAPETVTCILCGETYPWSESRCARCRVRLVHPAPPTYDRPPLSAMIGLEWRESDYEVILARMIGADRLVMALRDPRADPRAVEAALHAAYLLAPHLPEAEEQALRKLVTDLCTDEREYRDAEHPERERLKIDEIAQRCLTQWPTRGDSDGRPGPGL